MMTPLLLILLQAPATAGAPGITIDVTPSTAAVRVGDTLRLHARARDATGRPVPDLPIVWRASGEGTVEGRGLVRAGYAGYVRVTAEAGGATARATVVVHPRPTASVEIRPMVRRIVAGTRVTLNGWAFSPDGDRTYEPVEFASSNPRVAAVTPEGRLTAATPGSAVITAAAGPVAEHMTIVVLPNGVATVTVSPSTTSVRVGDVVRFTAAAADRRGRPVRDVFTEWSVAALTYKAVAQIDQRGAFVAAWPGKYTVTADIGGRRADAVIEVRRRAAGRTVEVLGRLPLPVPAEALWLTPRGRCAYIGTDGGPIYVVDVGRPDGPRVVDSMPTGGARVAAIRVAVDRPVGVFTREHAQGSGLVVFDTAEPCRPRPIADEVRPAAERDADDFVYGRLNAVDVADLTRPNGVAWYEPTDAGIHDFWLDGETLYVGASQGGLRVLDVSGELKGDLLAQGREIAWLPTADSLGLRPFRPMTRGVAVRDGLVYAVDPNSGLWIVRLVSTAAR